MTNSVPLRHGDWHWRLTTRVPDEANRVESGTTFVFGEGEATGHLHECIATKPKDMAWYKDNDAWIAKILAPVEARHPEHSLKGDLKIPEGTYEVYKRKEKDWFSQTTRKVID